MTTDFNANSEPHGLPEPEEVKELDHKYAEERDKRYKARGEHQYLALREIRDAEFAKDPFLDYERARALEEGEVHDGDFRQVVIVGAGHNGILLAVRLIEAGIGPEQILLIDNASGYGGVWYWNRYPGLMCDVESYVYLPLLEETGYIPKHRYSHGEEIRANTELIAKKYHLQALFTTTATKMDWDEERVEWTTEVRRDLGPSVDGEDSNNNSNNNNIHNNHNNNNKIEKLIIKSRFLLIAAGPLTGPKMPDVPGIDDYLAAGGHMFHSARWEYGLTGGSQQKPELTKLQGKKVAVVGTAATGVQVVPEVAKWAEKLYVCQRTPSYVGIRGQKETDPDEFRQQVATGPGWQEARVENFGLHISNDPPPGEKNLVNDGWVTDGAFAAFQGGRGKYPIVTPEVVEDHVAYFKELDLGRANDKRALVDQLVADKAVADRLKPWYFGWCKRPVFNDNYLPAFSKPNVQLVDLDGKGIDRFTRHGIVANGVEYAVDLVILATGFEVPPYASAETRAGAPIRGRHGRLLDEKWNAPDYGTLHGYMTHDFPNLFFQGVFGQAVAPNLTMMYDFMGVHVAFLVEKALAAAAAHQQEGDHPVLPVVETPKAAEDEWNDELAKRALFWTTMPLCTPGYFTGDAQVKPPQTPAEAAFAAKRIAWPGGATDFKRVLARWRESGAWTSLISTRPVPGAAQTNGVDKV